MGRWCLVGLLVILCSAWGLAKPCPPGVHPIVEASYGEEAYANLLGGTVDGAWVMPDKFWKRVTGGERYELYSPFKKLAIVATGKQAVYDQDTGAHTVALDAPKEVRESTEAIFGICGDWNALPRVPKAQSPEQAVYRQVVRALLDANGMKRVPVHIDRLWRIDLEGDGTDEVLIEAGAPGLTYEDNKQNYSMVLARKIVKGTVRTIILSASYGTEGGLIQRHALKSVLDVNGDGIMEIITRSSWYDGQGLFVETIINGTSTTVLESGFSG